MLRVLPVTAVVLVILLIDAPRLVRNRLWGELATHSILMVSAAVLFTLNDLGVEIPSLVTWIRELVRPLGETALFWLGG